MLAQRHHRTQGFFFYLSHAKSHGYKGLSLKIIFFWIFKPCGVVCLFRCSAWRCRFHLQGGRVWCYPFSWPAHVLSEHCNGHFASHGVQIQPSTFTATTVMEAWDISRDCLPLYTGWPLITCLLLEVGYRLQYELQWQKVVEMTTMVR